MAFRMTPLSVSELFAVGSGMIRRSMAAGRNTHCKRHQVKYNKNASVLPLVLVGDEFLRSDRVQVPLACLPFRYAL